MEGSLPTWITMRKLKERSPSSSSTVSSPRSSVPTKISAVSEDFGTTRICVLPKSFFRYPSIFRTSWTSTDRSYLKATSCLIGQPGASDPSTVQHDAVEHLVHGAGRLRAARLTHDFRRDAGDSDIVRYRFDDNRARRN